MFLDRDGTIIIDRNFPGNPADVELLAGAAEALRRLQAAGYLLIVISNQSGIARGLLTEADYLAVQRRTEELLSAEGVGLDGVWFCPHHPDFTGACECRKPGLRLFREAAETLDVDMPGSVFVGDRLSDVLPALAFGGLAILVRTGKGSDQAAQAPPGIQVAENLTQAAERALRARFRG